jgi:hypothetical protein
MWIIYLTNCASAKYSTKYLLNTVQNKTNIFFISWFGNGNVLWKSKNITRPRHANLLFNIKLVNVLTIKKIQHTIRRLKFLYLLYPWFSYQRNLSFTATCLIQPLLSSSYGDRSGQDTNIQIPLDWIVLTVALVTYIHSCTRDQHKRAKD